MANNQHHTNTSEYKQYQQEIEEKQYIEHKVDVDGKDYIIMAPFLKNVLMKLLDDSAKSERSSNTEYIHGLSKVKRCYYEWDLMVNKACNATPIQHPIWRHFIHGYDVVHDETIDDIDIIQYLFNEWIYCDPTKQEMNQYIGINAIQTIWKSLHNAITRGQFKHILHRKKASKQEENTDFGLIVCPFLTNIVQELLNIDSNHYYFDDEWSEGLKVLNECYPEWNVMITKCVRITPISHPIWKRILNESQIKHKEKIKSEKQILKCLLSLWIHLKQKIKCYSVHPPTKTRQKYIRLKDVNAILEPILCAFNDGMFDYYLIVSTRHVTGSIFGVFLKHIMCKLIHKSLDIKELQVLRECYPDWDKLINECCGITPINHNIWREFIKTYSISNKKRLSDTDIIKYQLDYCIENDMDPSLNEQKKYTKLVVNAWCKISRAVIHGTFKPFMDYKLEQETKRRMKLDDTLDDTKEREATPLIIDDEEEKNDIQMFDSVPAPYSRTHRTLSLISYQSYASREEFQCKICHKMCSDLDGIPYGDDDSTFCCDICVEFNLNLNKDSLDINRNTKESPLLSPRTEKQNRIPYHMKEHKLFNTELTDDSPFNYDRNRDKALDLDLDWKDNNIYNPIIEAFEDQSSNFNTFDVEYVKSDTKTQDNEDIFDFAVQFEDEIDKIDLNENTNMIKIFWIGILIVFCGIYLMNIYSHKTWIQFMIKLLSIIHFLSVSSLGLWLFLLWLRSLTDFVYQRINRFSKEKIVDIDSYRNVDTISYPKLSKSKRRKDEEHHWLYVLFSRICDLTKKLFNQYVFIGFGVFCLYLLIVFDNMLPPILNILNVMSFGKVLHVLWVLYVGYLLYGLLHGDVIIHMSPVMYCVFMIGSMGIFFFFEEFIIYQTVLCCSCEFVFLTAISIII